MPRRRGALRLRMTTMPEQREPRPLSPSLVDRMHPEWGQEMHCPWCKMECVHFEEPSYQECDDYSAWAGRGRALRIPMHCECGCAWTLRLGFHKGTTYVLAEDWHVAEWVADFQAEQAAQLEEMQREAEEGPDA